VPTIIPPLLLTITFAKTGVVLKIQTRSPQPFRPSFIPGCNLLIYFLTKMQGLTLSKLTLRKRMGSDKAAFYKLCLNYGWDVKILD
jgi:hypothetical protein